MSTAAIIITFGAIFLLIGLFNGMIVVKFKDGEVGSKTVLSDSRTRVAFVIGAILIVIGVGLEIAFHAPPTTTSPTSPSTVVTINASLPTQTLFPTVVPPLFTQPPTKILSSPSPIPTLGIENGCINSNSWAVYGDQIPSKDNNGCLQLGSWGIDAQQKGLLIYVDRASEDTTRSIYTPLSKNVRIDFTFQISKLITLEDARIANIAFGIVPSKSPTNRQSGLGFSFQVETIGQEFLFFKTRRVAENPKYVDIRLKIGENYRVSTQVDGPVLKISLNGDSSIVEPFSIPFEQGLFWIGYTVPVNGTISARISDLTITQK